MAGLLAARALADHYERVTLLERDTFPDTVAPRKAVPQGRHTHVLLAPGREVLEEFFPGLTADLVEAGAWVGDATGDTRWFLEGGYKCQPTSGLLGLQASRPLLEGYVRRRLLSLPNVRAVEASDVVGLEMDAAGGRVVGVRVRREADAGEALFLAPDAARGKAAHVPASS
jgi:2-polyprenyl-6-methoxyphenol hydroxylase-like FAD-dependent oxidoreductase